jgi:glycolate oxidase FAD binding subunit
VTEFSGNEKVLARCQRDFRQMAGECDATNLSALSGEDASAVTGRVREFLPMALAAPQATIVKISVLPSHMTQILAIAEQAAEINSLECAAMARGLGILYFALLPADRGEESRRRVIQASEHILTECGKLDGNGSIPWLPSEWPVEWKESLKVWGPPRGDFEQMRKVKNIFDPGSILSPGRFVGSL